MTNLSEISEDNLTILTYNTSPIEGQRTGTSGMRKKTNILLSQPNFLPNWIQSLFNALSHSTKLENQHLIIGGDGRFYNKVAIQTILRIAAANRFAKVTIGRNGILTTPAASAIVPRLGALGAIILTASHNPAGPHGDWGVKYNTAGGAPALEALTQSIYEETTRIQHYYMADLGLDIDLRVCGTTSFAGGRFVVEVIHPVSDYCRYLKTIFDFDAIRSFVARPDFSMLFDAMHASTGEYAHVILGDELGLPHTCVLNGTPLEDFGGGHPDPNLTYAAQLVDRLNPDKFPEAPQFGAASDGDGDRNMILGRGVFVSPGDSVAIIADYASRAIPYFKMFGLKGVARSMPTSSALDRVAEKLGIPVYETPTGWKYFTNLMDAGLIQICGEESFGTSSNHIREKDGLWAVLAWLSILAYRNQHSQVGQFVSVEDILIEHWQKYGRTYNLRYDFESVQSEQGEAVMTRLRSMVEGAIPKPASVIDMTEFEYVDPVDGSVSSKQGIILKTNTGARAVFRLSGTGSEGATIRMYFEQFEDPSKVLPVRDSKLALQDVVEIAMEASDIANITGRSSPTVIT